MKTKIQHIFLMSYLHIVLKSYRLKVFPSYFLIVIFISLLSILSANGQGKNEEVTIIAPYIPSIGNANKIPFRPEVTPEEQQNPTFEYNYITKPYEAKLELEPIEPMKYSGEEQEQLYRNYAKLGIGLYATPYLDFMASSLQSEKYQFGVRLKHLSSQGKIKEYPPSAYSHSLVSIYGRVFTKTHTILADAGYNYDVVHHYGFRPDSFPDIEYTKDDLKQRFQHVYGNLEFGSNYKDEYKLNHKVALGLNHFSDLYNTRETEVSFLFGMDKAFESGGKDLKHSFSLDFGFDFFSYKDSLKEANPAFIPIKPVYHFAFGQYRFQIGFKIVTASGDASLDSTFSLGFFPILKAEVVVVEEKVKAFAEISGDRKINSFRGLAGINPFMISTPTITFTDEMIKIGGGITGNFNGLNFTADAYYSYFQNMPLYVNDTAVPLQNQFMVIYDNINLLQVRASLGYIRYENLTARLQATLYHYIPKDEEKAWHLPNYEVVLDVGYILKEKYTLRASILATGSKYARTYQDGIPVAEKIKGSFDLGAGFEYRINRMISVYADINNILNQNYQRWYEYPVQGILVMAGAKISF